MRVITIFSSMMLALMVLLPASPIFAQRIEKVFPDAWGNEGFNLTHADKSGVRVIHSIQNLALDDFETSDGVFKNIELSGIFLPNDEGAPNLPGTGRFIAIPQGSTPVLQINAVRKQVIQNVEIIPAPNIPLGNDDSPLSYVKDPKIYSKNAYFPQEPIRISEPTQLRGVDVVMLGITPFQYNPVTKELVILHDIDVEVRFVGGNGQFGDNRLRSPWWDPILQDHLLNQQMLPVIDYSARAKEMASTRATGCEYLIISPNDAVFQQWADSLRRFRTRQGILTNVVTLSQVGGNTATILENYINNAYNTWDIPPAAVLLLGDFGTNAANSVISPIYNSYCVSDNILADIDGNHLPDITFARITATNAAQLQTMVGKVLKYERTPPTNPNFYNNPITALGWQTERWFQICAETIGGFWKNAQGKQPVRINEIYSGTPGSVWSTATNTATVVNIFGPNGLGYIPASPATLGGWTGGNATMVNNAINSGAFMLLHRNHGLETGWGEPYYLNSHINGLTNNDLTFVWSVNCLTGKFNWSGESFAEKFHRHQFGAVGIIAASEISYSFVNDTYVWGAYDNMWPNFMPQFGTNPPSRGVLPAFANSAGKIFLEQSSWPFNVNNKQVTYHLFHHHGCAFLTIYSEMPQPLTVNHMPVLLSGLDFFEVTANAGSLIALTANDQIIGVANGTGSPVSIPIVPQLPGANVVITVTKQNFFRYETTISSIPPAGPYLLYYQTVVNDTLGNNNGQIDFGEPILTDIALRNLGSETAENVVATLSTSSNHVTITDNTGTFGSIVPGAIVVLQNAFSFDVSDSVPNNTTLQFDLQMVSGDGTWTGDFTLIAFAPHFAVGNYSASDPTGNNNGRLDPGETADILISTINNGQSDAFDAIGTLTLSDPFVTVNSSSYTFSSIGAGQTVNAAFNITISPSAPIGHAVNFSYTVQAGAYQAQRSFVTKLGLILEDFESGNFNSFTWTFGGAQPWTVVNTGAYEGTFAARSGVISHSQRSELILQYEVGVSDSISFFRSVSSESGYDFLRFFINNVRVGEWSGNVAWGRVAFPVSAGMRTFRWEYSKDGSMSNGSDCAWVDYIVFPPMIVATGNAGTDGIICQGETYQLNGAATNFHSFFWTTSGDGTFSNALVLNPVYTPGSADINNGGAVLTLNVVRNTTTVTDNMVLTINRLPVVSAGINSTVCEGSSLLLENASASFYSQLLWATSGTGSFSDPTILNPTYTPSADDIAAGNVTLTLQADGMEPCGDASHSIVVSIVPQPQAFAGSNIIICRDATVQLDASASNYSALMWTTSGTGTFNNNSILNAVYTPSEADIAAGNITLTLTAAGVAPCANTTSDMTVQIMALPTAQLSGNHSICLGYPAPLTFTLTGTAPWIVVDGNNVAHTITESPWILNVSPLTTTTYTLLTVTDANNCTSTATGSATVTVNFPPLAPAKPAGPDTIDFVHHNSSVFTIEEVGNATGYTWSLEPTEAGTITTTGTSATVAWSSTYQGNVVVKANAHNDCGQGDWSDNKQVLLKNTTGIGDVAKDWGLNIYPNPSQGTFMLTLMPGKSTRANLIVTNLIGKVVYSESVALGANRFTKVINLEHLESGIYIFSIESAEMSAYRKMIIRR